MGNPCAQFFRKYRGDEADQKDASILLLSTADIAADAMVIYAEDLDQMGPMTEEYRLVNRGYMLNHEYYKYHFEENGMRIFISSKHLNQTCTDYTTSLGLTKDCEAIIAENWPGYGGGRSHETLFYGRTGVRLFQYEAISLKNYNFGEKLRKKPNN